MEKPYVLEGSLVLKDGRGILTREEVIEFATHAIRRRLRERGYADAFLKDVNERESAEISWNFLTRGYVHERYLITLSAVRCAGGFILSCRTKSGETADCVTHQVCSVLHQRKIEALREPKARKRRVARRVTRARRPQIQEAVRPAPVQAKAPKVRRRVTAAPISEKKNERFLPQFRKHTLFWEEAAKAVISILEVKANWKHSAAHIVAKRLHDSLDQNGGRFAIYRKDGFALRFDLVDGIWRGDITPLSVSATKDNTHRLYRRMRAYFREGVFNETKTKKQRRREKRAAALQLPTNVVIMAGMRFAA